LEDLGDLFDHEEEFFLFLLLAVFDFFLLQLVVEGDVAQVPLHHDLQLLVRDDVLNHQVSRFAEHAAIILLLYQGLLDALEAG